MKNWELLLSTSLNFQFLKSEGCRYLQSVLKLHKSAEHGSSVCVICVICVLVSAQQKISVILVLLLSLLSPIVSLLRTFWRLKRDVDSALEAMAAPKDWDWENSESFNTLDLPTEPAKPIGRSEALQIPISTGAARFRCGSAAALEPQNHRRSIEAAEGRRLAESIT